MSRKQAERFWRGVEDVGGLCSTRAGWEALCGKTGYGLVKDLLEGTAERADWYPVVGRNVRILHVKPRIDGDRPDEDGPNEYPFVAFSDDPDYLGGDLMLTKADVAVRRLPIKALAALVAKGLRFPSPAHTKETTSCAIRLGQLPTHGLSVYLVAPCSEREFAVAFAMIRQKDTSPLAIVTPTSRFLPPDFRHLEDSGDVQHAALCDLTRLGADGIEVITPLSERLFPVRGTPGGPPYKHWPHQSPAHPQPAHVEMVFRDTENMWIQFGESQGTFRFTDIWGFATRNGGHRTIQYSLLLLLAAKDGQIQAPPRENEQAKRLRTRLERILKGFFGTKAAFIRKIGPNWVCTFHIRWAGTDEERDKLICPHERSDHGEERPSSLWGIMVGEAISPETDPRKKHGFR